MTRQHAHRPPTLFQRGVALLGLIVAGVAITAVLWAATVIFLASGPA